MSPEKILKRINIVVSIVSGFYLLDTILPYQKTEGLLVDYYRPTVPGSDFGGSYLSDSELILMTTEGNVKVLTEDIIPLNPGEKLIVSKSSLLKFNNEVELVNSGRKARSSCLLMGWLLPFPYMVFFLAVVALYSKNKLVVQNAGSAALIFCAVTIIALLVTQYM